MVQTDRIKKAMVLAGGSDQIELIRGLRRRFPGIEITLVDMASPVAATPYADSQLVLSTMDFEGVLAAARARGVDMILVNCGDQPLRTMAYVSGRLGLPCYLSYEQALALTNKVQMKARMVAAGIPTARYRRFTGAQEVDTAGLRFPLVIKPADNNGSKGIVKVFDRAQLEAAVAEARRYSVGGDMLVEEYKEGQEYSVEAFLRHGEPVIVFASQNNKIKDQDRFTICQNVYLSSLPQELEAEIKAIVRQIGRAFGIDNVPLLIQLIAGEGGEVSVIEFSARTGGGSKLFFIRRMTGVDIVDNLVDITLGREPVVDPRPRQVCACINYLYARPGTFAALHGLEGLVADGTIAEFYQYKPFGAEIHAANYSNDRPAGFLTEAPTPRELRQKIARANDRLKILDPRGRDIMRHDILGQLSEP